MEQAQFKSISKMIINTASSYYNSAYSNLTSEIRTSAGVNTVPTGQRRIESSEKENNSNIRGDSLTLSPEGKALAAVQNKANLEQSREIEQNKLEKTKLQGEVLSEAEMREVEKLRQRDQKVKAHEQAHLAAGGGLVAGGVHYKYKTGPDGQRYAVGGEVKLRIPNGSTPEESLSLALKAERAALAPADPSPQDRAAAAKARQKANQARREITQKNAEQVKKNAENTTQNAHSIELKKSELNLEDFREGNIQSDRMTLKNSWMDKVDMLV